MSNIKLCHYDDGKKKLQSHEVYLKEENFYNVQYDIHSHDIFDIRGYGETEEEAMENFRTKIKYLFNEFRALEKMLFETNIFEIDKVEVDCLGREVK